MYCPLDAEDGFIHGILFTCNVNSVRHRKVLSENYTPAEAEKQGDDEDAHGHSPVSSLWTEGGSPCSEIPDE